MTREYTFNDPLEMTDFVLSDIVADLVHVSNRETKKGNLVNASKLNRAKEQIISVINRNYSEDDFLAVNDV